MGVPAFFRWLTDKYPKVLQDVLEARVAVDSHGTILPFDLTLPNPSGLECDNFYIDMNGIIHPCSHPENGPQPQSEVEMYENVCRYIDRLFRVARPRKLLYLAIDGVAPRAKMNQQRARRFRSAEEVREKNEIEKKVRSGMKDEGIDLLEEKDKSSGWDSNVITPGTPFMKNLSDFVRFYIRKRMSEDKAWKQIKVIFSDASIPGEGEHKIMAHIRLQRTQPTYDPNLVHILHGLDADLIMLALATHEAHFYILREEVVFGRRGHEFNERRKEQSGFTSQQLLLDEEVGAQAMALRENRNKPLVRLSIPILKEYLYSEFRSCENVPFQGEVSFERVIDDIVFLCFFVGNDFLPHLPSLDIRDGALDFLFNVYKRILPTLGSYITDHGGKVNLSNVDVIMAEVGAIEDHVFNMRHEEEKRKKEQKEQAELRKKQNRENKLDDPGQIAEGKNIDSIPQIKGRSAKVLDETVKSKKKKSTKIKIPTDGDFVALGRKNSSEETNKKKRKLSLLENAKAAKELKKKLKNSKVKPEQGAEVTDTNGNKTEGNESKDNKDVSETVTRISLQNKEQAEKLLNERIKALEKAQLESYAKNVDDKVRLHEKGWKDRYYKDKCKAENISGGGGREHLFRSYIKGLCWVMQYYYNGVPSWKWYFPFHYAPFASDLKNIERFQSDCENMELATPFSPVEQLLSVLPSDSAHAVPKASRWLMKDEESPIIDFYPDDILCDPNGKAMPWLWVVLLPFIEEDRMLDALKPTMKDWTKYEHFCNARGLDNGYIYIHQSHPQFSTIEKAIAYPDKTAKHRLPKCEFNGMVRPPLSDELIDIESEVEPPPGYSLVSSDGLLDQPILSNECLCAAFSEPRKLPHKSVLLANAKLNAPVLTPRDFAVIRRPRLNMSGLSIANLGGGGQNQQGGGMHVDRNVRDNHGANMPTGMRQWGTLEPSWKRSGNGNSNGAHQKPYKPNLFNQNHGNFRTTNKPYSHGIPGQHQRFGNNLVTRNNGGGVHTRFGDHTSFQNSIPPPPIHHRPPQPFPNQSGMNFQRPPPQPPNWAPPNGLPPPPPYQPQHTQNTNFSFNRRNAGPLASNSNNNPNRGKKKSSVNPELMQTLRSQLASTLKQNRQSGKRN